MLITALNGRVPIKLLDQRDPLSYARMYPQLVRMLVNDYAVDNNAAEWAVASWEFALGIQPATNRHLQRRGPKRSATARALIICVGLGTIAVVAFLFMPVRAVVFPDAHQQPFHTVLAVRRIHSPLDSMSIVLLGTHSKRLTTITRGQEVRLRISWDVNYLPSHLREGLIWRVAWHNQTLLKMYESDMATKGNWHWDYLLTVDTTWPSGDGYLAIGSVRVGKYIVQSQLPFAVVRSIPVSHVRVRPMPYSVKRHR